MIRKILIFLFFLNFAFSQMKYSDQMDSEEKEILTNTIENIVPNQVCILTFSEKALNDPRYRALSGHNNWYSVRGLIDAGYINHIKEDVKAGNDQYTYTYEDSKYHYNEKVSEDFDIYTSEHESYLCSKSAVWNIEVESAYYDNNSSRSAPPMVTITYAVKVNDKPEIQQLLDEYPNYAFTKIENDMAVSIAKKRDILAYNPKGFISFMMKNMQKTERFYITDQGYIHTEIFNKVSR